MTSNYVNYSRRNPKRSAQCVYHTGTLASSIARAGTSYEKEERKTRSSSSTRWTSFPFLTITYRKDDLYPELLHKEGPTKRSQVRESTWLQRVPHCKSTSKEVSQKEI